ncbi:MAG: nuclear transport factor 2 family protein [Sulfuriferula sp.]|nr:nuclear transport factor 2 family protein [Sulfuriferula sp.]
MKKTALLCLLLGSVLPLASTWAAAADNQSASVPVVTRLVQIFSVLERDLEAHVQKGDAAAMETLLTDDFEMRIGAMPGNPIPRAQWLHQFTRHTGSSFDLQQMAVHDYGSVAVVSFLLKQDKSSKSAGDIYIVDVWKKSGNDWQLAVRYASPAGNANFPIPGAMIAPHLDKRY